MKQSIDINIIEQMVSGELSIRERKALLQRIDDQAPSSWRTLALAYIEKHTLQESFALTEPPEETESPKAAHQRFLPVAILSAAMLMIGALLGTTLNQPSQSQEAWGHKTQQPLEATDSTAQSSTTTKPRISYIATRLENGNRVVIPISHFNTNE